MSEDKKGSLNMPPEDFETPKGDSPGLDTPSGNAENGPVTTERIPRGGGPGGPPGMGGGEKAKNFKGTMGRLLKYLGAYKVSIAVVVILATASAVLTVIAPNVLGQITTNLYNGVKTGEWGGIWQEILRILITLAVIYICAQGFTILQNFILARVTSRIVYDLRRDLDLKIAKLPLKYLDGTTHGELLSRVVNDTETVSMTLQQSMPQIVTAVITFIGVICMMFSINVAMAAASMIIIPLTVIISSVVVKKSQKYFRGQQKAIGDMNSHVEEMYTGHTIVKSFNYEDKAKSDFTVINDKIRTNAKNAEFFSSLMMPLSSVLTNLSYAAMAAAGCLNVINGKIDVGQVQAFLQYMRQFGMPISTISNMASTLQSAAAAAERIFEVLNEEEEVPDKEPPKIIEHVKGNVSIEHVKFGYSPDKIIISDLNLEVKSGQTIAIVGPTGAGKTTLINLLMRFYDVNGGSIRIDGVDVRDMRRDDLRSIFGMVLQDTWLFNGTIEENLAYGRDGATHEEVVDAAKKAYAHHFIKAQPDGYATVINEEGSNISQGQKQLLTIARAIVADPAILILDEATSSVDTRTEVLIQNAMNKLMEGRTSFVIAHRLSTIRGADTILVMNNGNVVEQGNHDELLAKGGFYAALYNSQFENSESA